jgi:acylglycerol lipase
MAQCLAEASSEAPPLPVLVDGGSEAVLAPERRYRVLFEPLAGTAAGVDPDAFPWLLDGTDGVPGVTVVRQTFPLGSENVAYRLWRPAQTPVALAILLHGACDYCAAFEELGSFLAMRGIASLACDQRGCGSRRSRGRSLEVRHQLGDLAAARELLRVKIGDFYGMDAGATPLFLLGESMGGGVAVRAAARGLSIDGLVLVAPASLACPYRRVAFQTAANALSLCAPRSLWRIERRGESELSDAAAIRFLGDPFVLRGVPSRMMAELFSLAAEAARVAPRVKVPSLTFVGSEENVLRRECVETLHRRLGGPAEIESVKGAGHFLLHATGNEAVFRRIAVWMLRKARAAVPA